MISVLQLHPSCIDLCRCVVTAGLPASLSHTINITLQSAPPFTSPPSLHSAPAGSPAILSHPLGYLHHYTPECRTFPLPLPATGTKGASLPEPLHPFPRPPREFQYYRSDVNLHVATAFIIHNVASTNLTHLPITPPYAPVSWNKMRLLSPSASPCCPR